MRTLLLAALLCAPAAVFGLGGKYSANKITAVTLTGEIPAVEGAPASMTPAGETPADTSGSCSATRVPLPPMRRAVRNRNPATSN